MKPLSEEVIKLVLDDMEKRGIAGEYRLYDRVESLDKFYYWYFYKKIGDEFYYITVRDNYNMSDKKIRNMFIKKVVKGFERIANEQAAKTPENQE